MAAVWRQRPLRTALLSLTVLAALGGSSAVLLVSGLETWGRHAAGLDVAPGHSHDGLPLARTAVPQGGQLLRAAAPANTPADDLAADQAALAGLTLRQSCAWGQPGRNPYRGTTEQALTAAGLPPDVVRQIAAQRRAGQKVGRLKISRNAIRLEDGSRYFNPRQMAMSFDKTLCLNTWVNFAPGHVEAADLFEARDEQGRLYTVMVPDACGNVTVLGAHRPGGVVAGALADRSAVLLAVADALSADAGAGGPGGPEEPDGSGNTATPLPSFDRAIAWPDPGGGRLPRTTLIAGLNGSAELLARASTTITALPKPGGAPGPSVSATRQSLSDLRSVPEPGTLLCVLAALAGLVWVGRRGG